MSLSTIWKYLWPHIRKYRTSFYLVFVAYGLGTLIDNIVKPYVYKEIVDAIAAGGPTDAVFHQLILLACILAGIIVTYNIFYRIGDYATTHFQSSVMRELRNTSLRRLLDHSYSFFSSSFSGGLVAKAKRFSASFETLHDIVSFNVWFSVVQLTGVFVVLFIKVPLLGYIFLIWTILYIVVTLMMIRRKVPLDLAEASADSKVTARLADVVTSIINVKVFTGRRREEEAFGRITADEEMKRRTAWNQANFQNIIQAIFMMALQITLVFVMIRLWRDGSISVGTIVLVQAYLMSIFDILWILGRSLMRGMKALADMQEIVDIFELAPDICDPADPEISRISKGEIVFKDVDFSYHAEQNIFKGFNIEIASGARVGIVGHSGAGKTTITKLLLRFADVTGGQILIDGQDIRHITQDDLRRAISYVPQEPMLFHRTIRENIAYGKPDATEAEIIDAAKKAHAHEFIIGFKNGYDTYVGERGVKLSGGERQRIAIARAMLKDAPILMLDEATSSLDSVSETYIQEALEVLMQGKTVIVIAHRLSTIQKMDRIIVIENGAIAEDGSHTQLLRKKGIYAELWNHQSGGFIE